MIHYYYGYGKGKTTGALGLGMRAHGAGMSILLVQFLKDSVSQASLIRCPLMFLKRLTACPLTRITAIRLGLTVQLTMLKPVIIRL